MSKPTHIAYVVNKANKPGVRGFLASVGAVFAHGKGTGFDLVLYDQISVWAGSSAPSGRQARCGSRGHGRSAVSR